MRAYCIIALNCRSTTSRSHCRWTQTWLAPPKLSRLQVFSTALTCARNDTSHLISGSGYAFRLHLNNWNVSKSFTDQRVRRKKMYNLSEIFRHTTPSTVKGEGESLVSTNTRICTADWCCTPNYLRQIVHLFRLALWSVELLKHWKMWVIRWTL